MTKTHETWRLEVRHFPRCRWLTLLAAVWVLSAGPLAHGHPRDYAVQVHATVEESPPAVHLAWPSDPTAQAYWVFKKQFADPAWGDPVAVLAGSATTYTDHDVAVGRSCEYSLRKTLGFVSDTVAVASGTAVTFTIRDAWGDGICCEHGLGEYTVTGCGVTYASGGAFGHAESTAFTVGLPGEPCEELAVSITLDLYGQETTWELTDDATGAILASGGPYAPPQFGHILAGIRAAAQEEPGAVLLLVEQEVAQPLAPELERLELDMIRGGWRVRRLDVSGNEAVPAVKDRIVGACAADPSINTLFLLGHIAVPYSGDICGGHLDHHGAWPADVYYGELDGVWTDSIVYDVSASRPENHNIPGDGKFDQTFLPSDVDLQVGRVDLSRLPAFALSDVGLLRRYLDKDHAWRTGSVAVAARGLIDDNVGDASGAAFAAFGWRNFSAMFGPENVHAGNFVPDLQTESHLWAYGCGGSSYTQCGGVASTNDFATRTFLSVFTILYGSYFGDWDNTNNVLRAPLGAEGYPLACFWAGRPTWHVHPMALGWPIGYCARLVQNNHTLYTIGDGGREVHIALMGDPTLGMHAVQPPHALRIDPFAGQGCRLTWSPSPDPVEGYHVYRAGSLHDRFVRITSTPVADTTYVDAAPPPGSSVYSVRGLMLQHSASGTYCNLSMGALDSVVIASAVDPGEAPAGGPGSPPDVGPDDAWGPDAIRTDLAVGGWPSPFALETRVFCLLPAAADVELRIFDVTGACVLTLADRRLAAGPHVWRWDGRDERGQALPAGIYQLALRAGDARRTGRVCLLR
jgi:hypothetical protein